MAELVAAKFSEEEMPVTFDPGDLRGGLKPRDFVIVPRGEGEDIAYVACLEFKSSKQIALRREPYPRVIRRATTEEVEAWTRRKLAERRALLVCKDKARELKLDIKISHVRIDDNERKAIFHFTSDQRVDFRALVKELNATLKLRIELWQVRVRDEARMIDGFGVCGQKLCCSTWLKDFSNIAIRMAKDQDIHLPPSKLSGQCGRLLCCLSYEVDQYRQMSREALPKGATVRFEDEDWVITDRNLVAGTYHISNRTGTHKTIKATDLNPGEEPRIPEQMRHAGKKIFKTPHVVEELEEVLREHEPPTAPVKRREAAPPPPTRRAIEEPKSPSEDAKPSGRSKKRKRRKGGGGGSAGEEQSASGSPQQERAQRPSPPPRKEDGTSAEAGAPSGRRRDRDRRRPRPEGPPAPRSENSPPPEGGGQPRPMGRRRKKNRGQQ